MKAFTSHFFARTVLPLAFISLAASALHADDWPQWLGPQRDAVWREKGIVESFPESGPTVRWRVPIRSGYSGPAVAKGRVYVMDRQIGKRDTHSAGRGQVPGTERILCLNEKDGKTLWQYEYDCTYGVSYATGPRTTPTVHGGKVYTLGAEGNLVCLDAKKGKLLWSRDFKNDFDVKTPMWGFVGQPLIDGKRLICLAGGEGSVVVAFDKDTGKELWRALSAKDPGYAPPMIYQFAGKRQLILWHPEAINSLDPTTGKPLWTFPHTRPIQSALTIPTPRKAGDNLFFTSFYNGSLMLRVDSDEPSVVFASQKVSEKDTTELHSMFSTPVIENGFIYGVCSYGQLRCLNAETGERIWETFEATTKQSQRWGNAFLVKHGNRLFVFNDQGELIIVKMNPEKYEEISRAKILEPTNRDPGRLVVWSHPAFANKSIYVRNDKELVCVSLAKEANR